MFKLFSYFVSLVALSTLAMAQVPASWQPVDFSGLPAAKHKHQSLQGEWRIYPGQFLFEKDLDKLDSLVFAKMKIPGQSWSALAPQHYATVVVAVSGLPDLPLVILFDQFFGAHRSFFAWQDSTGWHQVPLVQTGRVTTNAQDNIMEGKRVMARPPRHLRSGLIISHLANFYSNGNIVGAPTIGIYPEYARMELVTKRWEGFFVLGSFFLLMISNLALYIQRPEDKSSLSMASIAFWLGFRYFSTEGLWAELLPSPNQFIWTIHSLGMILGNFLPGYFIVSFLNHSFPSHFPRRVVLGFRAFVVFLIAWLLWDLPRFSGWPQNFGYLSFMIMIPYTLFQSTRAAIAGLRGATISVIGTLFLTIAVVNDGLIAVAHAYDFIFLGHYGMLAYIFTQSMMVGKNFAFAFRTAAKLSRELKQEVARQTRDAKAILNNVHQGLITMNSDGTVNDDYAVFVKELLGCDEPAELNIRVLLLAKSNLSQEQQDNVLSVLCTVVGEDSMAFDMNVDNLPTSLLFDERRILELDWQPVIDESSSTVSKMLLAIKDVTILRELEQKNQEVQKDMQLIARLLEVSTEKFLIFYRSAQDMINESLRLILHAQVFEPDTVRLLFVNMHTIKGAARTYGFSDMTAVAHLCEQYYAQVQKGEEPWVASKAHEAVDSVSSILNQYYAVNRYKLNRDSVENVAKIDMQVVRDNILELQKISGTILNPELIPFVTKARSTFFNIYYTDSLQIFSELTAKLPALARDLGKEPPEVLVLGHGIGLTLDACEVLRRAFVHLLRNAMDHGIETAAERENLGKPAKGILTISQNQDSAGNLIILLKDDGRGLHLDRIHQKAVSLALRQQNDKLDPDILAALVFQPGFSTAKTVSEISGRGVGLDAVKQSLENVGGNVVIDILEYRDEASSCSFQFRLTLPANLWVDISHDLAS